MLKVVSVAHPAISPGIGPALAAAAAEAGAFEVSRIVPRGQASDQADQPLAVAGRWRLARYLGLRRALRGKRPDVVHLRADPCSFVALQVAGSRRRRLPDAALVLECDHGFAATPFWPFSVIRRRVLAQVDVAIVRHNFALRQLTAAGFAGAGFIVAPAPEAQAPPSGRACTRAKLGIPEAGTLVLGFIGALEPGTGIVDVLEGMAVCRPPVTLVIQGDGTLRSEIIDRAASLDVTERIVMLPAAPNEGAPDRAALLSALDVLIVMPRARQAGHAPFDRQHRRGTGPAAFR